MKPHRTPFLPVSTDIDDDALENLARDKGVGALVKPSMPASRQGEGAAPEPSPRPNAASPEATAPTPPLPSSSATTAATAATPRSRMKTINLELPDYVWTDLKIRSAHQQVSVRHIIMTALLGQGIAIRDVDMIEDGRRHRT